MRNRPQAPVMVRSWRGGQQQIQPRSGERTECATMRSRPQAPVRVRSWRGAGTTSILRPKRARYPLG